MEVAVSDENVQGSGDLNEICFVRNNDESKARPGSHFLLEFGRPLKYKIARRLLKTGCSCNVCLKTFRHQGVLRRHKMSKEHIDLVRVRMQKRML